MASVTISSDEPRSLRAVEIAAGASQWLKCRNADGEFAWGVPSQRIEGRYYVTTATSCTCRDFARHGLRESRVGHYGSHFFCKHALAVRLHEILTGAVLEPELPRILYILPGPRPSEEEAFAF